MHYWSKADNARLAARVLWVARSSDQSKLAEWVGYGGSTGIALYEAFLRECSISLELVIKAVIAQRLECGSAANVTKVRPVHNLPSLWGDARLPTLPQEDQATLVIAKQKLTGAGRYAAPKKDNVYESDAKELEKIDPPIDMLGGIPIRGMRGIDWDQFDRVYEVAAVALRELREHLHPSDV
jgi:hypothetical protein